MAEFGLSSLALALSVLSVLVVHLVEGQVVRDHRCVSIKAKTSNCTRDVYYPCPTDQDDDRESSEEQDDGDFMGSFIRRWMMGWETPDEHWCKRKAMFTCITFRTHTQCCPQWKLDEDTGTCSTPVDKDPPRIECKNGGTAIPGPRGPRCACQPHFTGSTCEEELCDLQCKNDGVCDVVEGVQLCVCPENFSGKLCETRICDGGCEHGRCEVSEGQTMCRCQKGWTGKRCEISDEKKAGLCPPITATTLGTCAETCKADSSCRDKMKCCFNGCGNMCSNPANFTCPYKKKNYKVGQVFNPDACHVCTCLTPDPSKQYGGARCTTVTCPTKPKCTRLVKDDNSCCGVCAEPNVTTTTFTSTPNVTTTTFANTTPTMKPTSTLNLARDIPPRDQATEESPYKKPTFVNCPKSLVILDVGPSDNEARLPLTLKARDYKNNDLHVFVVKEVFKAGIGEDNFDTVVATTARDSHENYAYCQFHVRIRDVHAPSFSFCPPDVLMTKEGVAYWGKPVAKDNVGLVRPPTSRHSPKDHFVKGEHLIVYTVEDYEGNIATCKFIVKVSSYESMRGRLNNWRRKQYLFIGCGAVPFLLVIAILIAAVYRRRRRRIRRGQEAPPQPPAYDNAVYGLATVTPPPYKEKPPMYADPYETIPETKMVVGDKTPVDVKDIDLSDGIDNPTYRM